MLDIENHSFFLAFYSQKTNGARNSLSPGQPLLDHLNSLRAKKIAFLDQPVPLSEPSHLCALEIYEKGEKKKTLPFPKLFFPLTKVGEKRKRIGGTSFRLKVRDFVLVVYFSLKSKGKYDFFIGSESINTLAGILMKKLGAFKKVVFYVVDLGPDRYGNKIINWLYLKLDKFCAYNSDFCFITSPFYQKMREEEFRYDKNKMAKHIVCPFGIDMNYIKILPEEKLINQVVFNGSIEEENCIELMIDAIPEVLKKIPDIRFKFIGGGPREIPMREKIKEMGLENMAEITGYFFDREKIRKDFCRSKAGLAIYPEIKKSMKAYGDPIKLKDYMACGLPIITTDVPLRAKEIRDEPMGIVIKPTKEELARAIIKIIEDKKFFDLCRENTLKRAPENTWEMIFDKAFGKMGT